ncbi:MAG: hypothetical protein KF773_27820 [Deltaproteobacteria bacterium]|nr:hypothetical protein [Deltaproteobacteria bacterium]
MRSLVLTVLVFGCGVEQADDAAPEESQLVSELTCAAGAWCTETAPIAATTMLRSVWAADANNVFAVGDAGTIVRRTNGAWSAMTSGTTQTLKGVWGTSATNVWAVGFGGTALRFDGTTWTPVSVGTTTNLQAVWMSSASDIWIAGPSTIWRSTNGGTSFTATGKAGSLFAISGTGPNDVWVTGENANVYHWANNTWTTVKPTTSTTTYYAVLALATNNVWVTDFYPGKETLRYNGSTWTAATTSIFNGGMSALSASDVWAVGATKVGRWNGSAWTVTAPLGTSSSLWSVATAPGHAWVVGSNALIGHYTY